MSITYSKARDLVLITLLDLLRSEDERHWFTAIEISQHSPSKLSGAFAGRAADLLYEMDMLERDQDQEIEIFSYRLSDQGIEEAERIESQNRLIQSISQQIQQFIPASDRLVSIGHNQPQYQEISDGISELINDVRAGWNGNPERPEERSRVLQGLEAAQSLWAATELKLIHVKVGILMAIEDAEAALGKIIKIAGNVLLVEAIRAFIKNANPGFDWGHF